MRLSLSLQERLVILVVAAVLPLSALSVWFTLREIDEATDRARTQLNFAASLVAANQDRVLEGAEQLLDAIAAVQVAAPDRMQCAQYFEMLRSRYPIYGNIGILDLEGKVICDANHRIENLSLAERPSFAQAVAERRFVMGQPVTSKASGRHIVPFARPLFEGDRVTGLVFAALDLERASASLARLQVPASARVVVTDRRGLVLMSHPPRDPAAAPTANAVVVDAARRLVAGNGEWVDPAGQPRIYAFAPSKSVGSEGFLAVVSIARGQVTYSSVESLRGEIAGFVLTLLAGLFAALWIGGRIIIKPAKQILGAVRRLEQGSLAARVPLPGGSLRGEFFRIGAAFNLMAESLQLRQLDLENELGRSRSAYAVLDQVVNSMQEALIAMNPAGEFLMVNDAARKLFPLEVVLEQPRRRAEVWGLFHADRHTHFQHEELPLSRALRGESGRMLPLFVRNAQVPGGRMLQCSWQPIHADGEVSGALAVFTDITELQRLQAEQAVQFDELRETQRKLIEAQRIGRVGNWELDLATGRLWWSDEVYELFGVRPGSIEPSLDSFERWVHPQDRHLLKPARDTALRDGQVMNVQYRIVRQDSTVAWMHEIGEARRNEYDEPVWFGGVVQDITARKRDEDALRESERELHDYTQMLQRAAEAAQAITALPTVHETMQQLANEARRVIASHMAVVSLTQGDDWSQVITALSLSDKHGAWGDFDRPPEGKGIYSLVCETNRPLRVTHDELLSHPRWKGFGGHAGDHPPIRGLLAVPLVDRQGRNLGLLQLSDKLEGDFTERDEYVALELAQLASIAIENARLFTEVSELNAGLEARIAERTAALAQQEKLYRTLAEQAPEVVWNTDATGRATFLNRAWYDLVGGEPGDWFGFEWEKRIHPDDVPEMRRNWEQSRTTLQPYVGTRRVLARDGSYHTMSYRGSAVLGEDGKVTSWVGIDADITGLKAIEEALRGSNQELEAFSYSVSHDLRAPLGAIAGFSKALALKLEGNADERVRHYLARIEAGVGKMEQLIDALLSLAKVARAQLHWTEVDLGALARETFEELRIQQPDRRVEVLVQDGLVVHGDPRMLRVMLQNLLGNAWKFTAHNDHARIEVGRLDEAGAFIVRDNGVGFDMAYAGKLFVAFQRLHTEKEFPGTGIGLATVRRIVARHQGKVWAESVLGDGTTFYFTLSEIAPPAWLAGEGASA
ncbi:MAG TPA: PAS domain-containing protein [Ramlibacter sp.]|nr:PAS domain-containing protein [Ramlibacter sp.]